DGCQAVDLLPSSTFNPSISTDIGKLPFLLITILIIVSTVNESLGINTTSINVNAEVSSKVMLRESCPLASLLTKVLVIVELGILTSTLVNVPVFFSKLKLNMCPRLFLTLSNLNLIPWPLAVKAALKIGRAHV